MAELGEGQKPCWIARDCSRYVYPDCLAYQDPEKPCWEHPYTQNEVLIGIKRECGYCKFFKLCKNFQD